MLMSANPEFVTRVMRDPRVWRWVCEDGVHPEQFSFNPNAVHFQLENKGFIMFRSITQTMREIHIAMLRGGPGIEQFVHDCLDEMRRRGARKFMAPIGDWNKPALRLARKCGFIEEGRVSATYVRNGESCAMIFMGSM